MNRALLLLVPLTALVLTAPPVHAQKAVYKCVTQGKVQYSHTPCVGAIEIDATPTQGADRWSGQSRKGRDVQRLEFNEQMGRAVRPLTGMDDAQWKTATHRQALSPSARQECDRLDPMLAAQRSRTDAATVEERGRADVRLWQLRRRFADLDC